MYYHNFRKCDADIYKAQLQLAKYSNLMECSPRSNNQKWVRLAHIDEKLLFSRGSISNLLKRSSRMLPSLIIDQSNHYTISIVHEDRNRADSNEKQIKEVQNLDKTRSAVHTQHMASEATTWTICQMPYLESPLVPSRILAENPL